MDDNTDEERSGMRMSTLEIKIKSYPQQCKNLIVVWQTRAKSGIDIADNIIFMHQQPKNPKSDIRRIAGLPAKCVSYLRDDWEIVAMKVENYIRLMIMCGVDIEVKEVTRND